MGKQKPDRTPENKAIDQTPENKERKNAKRADEHEQKKVPAKGPHKRER